MDKALVIVSGASGSGKSSIVNGLIARNAGKRVLTCTTRKPRANKGIDEVSGLDYFFLTLEEFETQKNDGAFAEHELNYGNYYGTRKKDIENTLISSAVAFAVVDTKGAFTLARLYPDAITVFIDAPEDDIRIRLVERGESEASIFRRMTEYDHEHAQASRFDVIIPNQHDELHYAVTKLHVIIRGRMQ